MFVVTPCLSVKWEMGDLTPCFARDANGFAQDGVQQLAKAVLGFDGSNGDHQLPQKLYNQYMLYSIARFLGVKLESDPE